MTREQKEELLTLIINYGYELDDRDFSSASNTMERIEELLEQLVEK